MLKKYMGKMSNFQFVTQYGSISLLIISMDRVDNWVSNDI